MKKFSLDTISGAMIILEKAFRSEIFCPDYYLKLKKFFSILCRRVGLPLRLIISILFLSILIPYNVYALDITAGAATWLAWGEQHSERSETKYTLDMESSPAFLYGPTLSVKFNEDFNLTFVFLYGR
ncbi:MAG: hypothetical protein FWH53_10420, partial [Leptospirales bacterium]|nr:hypothetical protein [Leptospirales bacterium]